MRWAVLLALASMTAACGEKIPPITWSGTVEDFNNGNPLEAVRVCVHGEELPCGETDLQGRFSLPEVPGQANVALSFELTDYFTTLYFHSTGEVAEDWEYSLADTFTVDAVLALAGEDLDNTKGQVVIGVVDEAPPEDDAVPDVTVSLSPVSGSDPVYFSDAGVPDTSLTATTTAGAVAVVNADPGSYVLSFSHASLTCSPLLAWPTQGANQIAFDVVAGHGIFVSAQCR